MAAHVSTANLDKYGDDDLFSTLLRYGLFVAAIFQLVCIGSSILLPGVSENSDGENNENQKPGADGVARRQHKLQRKLEKKKRR